MKKGLPLYHIERVVKETAEDFEDGSHIIYVNGAYKNDEDSIGRLAHDFGCVRSADMYNDLLKKQVHYFKETEGGRTKVCEIVENAAEKIAEKKAEKTKIDCIRNLMESLKLTAEQAMDALKIPVSEQSILIKKI